MKICNKLVTFVLTGLITTMISCKSSSTSGKIPTTYSNTTGWAYNSKNGGLRINNGYREKTPPNMVLIQGGTFTMGRNSEQLAQTANSFQRRVTVNSFYMDQYDITNANWLEYLDWTKAVFHNSPEIIERAKPDVSVWREDLAYNEPYVENYFENVAYRNYPVVGVTWEQAMDYCEWRTDRVNEKILIDMKKIKPTQWDAIRKSNNPEEIATKYVFSTNKYFYTSFNEPVGNRRDTSKVTMSDGILFPYFRLPTEAEWEYAAYGYSANKTGEVAHGRLYPWNSSQLRNPDKRHLGEFMANFSRGRGDLMGVGRNSDGGIIPMPVNSFFPNDYGLYCMAGNVNQWVLDVYRPLNEMEVKGYNPYRGNVFEPVRFNRVGAQNATDYKVDSLGRLRYVGKNIDDVRNYGDGSLASSSNSDLWKDTIPTGNAATALMYSPKGDVLDALAPAISNYSRVYKGGSWKDKPYWLNPSTRRYLDQNKCRDDIGFRCAMTRLGSPLKSK
ncbi:SUMF1/EgtB/PvdO family nonheme iron enzyme [Microbacter margulisiae]|uniref:Gliding motility-associated lipoprotein GldJ n=1 Tax=Microbacter margulisiae TaxID=1350067 RepID=A0A7W5H2X0_9PORP|nr:SUMF1/EgtB/PvdO family nonheme iron enzyme [Microbacter margulisiae]MBB3187999.1 gliding motility-associated lipoprotein GldJ [Microbacter margulisiae]